MKNILRNSVVALCLAASTVSFPAMAKENPFLKPFTGVYGIPQFDQIDYSDFIPAIKAGIEEQNANIRAIVVNRAVPISTTR